MAGIYLSYYDWLIAGLYFTGLLVLSYNRNWRTQLESEYLLSGRNVTLLPFIATLVSTWYGGILGVGEFTFLYGISQWFVLGVPYYLFALLFAWLLAGKIRANKALTIPEALQDVYGSKAAQASTILIAVLVSPAPYILMLGLVIQFITGGHHLMIYTSAVTLFSVCYISFTGFSAVVRTDVLQTAIMFSAFILLFIYCWLAYGPLSSIWIELPQTHRNPTGGNDLSYLLVWFFIALWTFVDPGFHQRAASAKTPATAKQGILWSVLMWFIFDLLTVSCGLYAVYALSGSLEQPVLAYPELARQVLPQGMLGLFLIGIIATIMSTLDSFLFLSGQTLGRDLLKPLLPHLSGPGITRLAIIASAIGGMALMYLIPSVVELWYTIGSIAIPGLLIAVLGIYIPFFTLTKPMVFPMMVSSSLIALFWFLGGYWTGQQPLGGIEPFYTGLLISGIFLILDKFKKPSSSG